MLTTPEMSIAYKSSMEVLRNMIMKNYEEEGRIIPEGYFPMPDLELVERLSVYECLKTEKENFIKIPCT